MPSLPFRLSLPKKSVESQSKSENPLCVPELYVSYPRASVPGTLNCLHAHLAALAEAVDGHGRPLCEAVNSKSVNVFVEYQNPKLSSSSKRVEKLSKIQKNSLGSIIFLTNSFYGSTQCLKELQQAKPKPTFALVLDHGLEVAQDSFSKQIKPYCDQDSKDFGFWSRRAEQANAFIGGTQNLPTSKIKFDRFTCSKCAKNTTSVCTKCSDYKRYMDSSRFVKSVNVLISMVNEVTSHLPVQSAATTPTHSAGVNIDFSNHSSVHSPTNGSGAQRVKRPSISSVNPRFDDDDSMDVDAASSSSHTKKSGNRLLKGFKHLNSWNRKNSGGASNRKGLLDDIDHDDDKMSVEDMDMDTDSGATFALHGNHDSVSSDAPTNLMETERVVYISTSEKIKPGSNAIQMPPKEQREKGIIYVVDNVRKKWDGRQWRRLCMVVGCGSAARGSTKFCVAHGRGTMCSVPGCDRETKTRSKMCSAHEKAGTTLNGGDGIRDRLENMVGKKKTRKGHAAVSTCSAVDCRAGVVIGSDMCIQHVGRCPFLTALGDTCGNMSDPRCEPLCYACWCYVNEVQPESIEDEGRVYGTSPTTISPMAILDPSL